MSLNHIIEGSKSDVDINVKNATVTETLACPSISCTNINLSTVNGQLYPPAGNAFGTTIPTPSYDFVGNVSGVNEVVPISVIRVNDIIQMSGRLNITTSPTAGNSIQIEVDLPPEFQSTKITSGAGTLIGSAGARTFLGDGVCQTSKFAFNLFTTDQTAIGAATIAISWTGSYEL
jgi:hypothetical protein